MTPGSVHWGMSQDPGLGELPGALVDYAAGVVDVLARGSVAVAIAAAVVGLAIAAVVGGGIAPVLAAIVGPAVVVGLWLELPSRLRDRVG